MCGEYKVHLLVLCRILWIYLKDVWSSLLWTMSIGVWSLRPWVLLLRLQSQGLWNLLGPGHLWFCSLLVAGSGLCSGPATHLPDLGTVMEYASSCWGSHGIDLLPYIDGCLVWSSYGLTGFVIGFTCRFVLVIKFIMGSHIGYPHSH